MVSAIAIFAHLFVNEVIYLGTIFENTIETTPTEQEEDEHHSEEMSTSQSPDAHASFDRRNEFTHNHACMTNGISYDVDNPDTHFDKIQTPTVIAGVAPNAPKILFLSKLSTKPYMHSRYYHVSPDHSNLRLYSKQMGMLLL